MKKKITALVLVLAVVCISLSPMLTLRTALAFRSPVSAFTSEIRKCSRSDNDTSRQCYIVSKPPVERATQHDLRTWAVVSVGPFHYAYYYGEG